MDVQELLKKVRQIEIKTKGLSRQIFSGAYHSVFKGRGMSFSEVREYVAGDDVRHIDWNVTARAGQTFVKVYEEERELTLMLMIDVSKSTYFGTTEQSKAAWITEIAAVLAFSATLDTKARIVVASGANAGTWELLSVVRDPAGIGYECRGRKL